MSGVFDKTIDSLKSSIDMRLLKQSVISSNIANAETPGYKAQKLDFEAALASAIDHEGKAKMHTSHPQHFPIGKGAISRITADIYENPDVNTSNDGNTVDLEREMSQLSENSILYKAATELINRKLALLKYAATDGGKA